jgi:hypothetical protein
LVYLKYLGQIKDKYKYKNNYNKCNDSDNNNYKNRNKIYKLVTPSIEDIPRSYDTKPSYEELRLAA